MSYTASDLAALCRTNLISYAVAEWPGYRPSWHHDKIAQKLEDVCAGRIKRLMISLPPRHGKSLLASEYFPAWYFGHHPEHQIMHATYSQELADGFGRKIRNQMRSEVYGQVFPGIKLAEDSSAAARFHTSSNGVYHAVGVGGSATGRGAHLLLIDDPIKGREEADSERQREKLKDWYKSVAYTRLMPGGAIIIIQTRWHEDDLMGWLIEEHTHEEWEILSLEALSEDGKALWPEAYPVESLLTIKKTVSEREWEALYQQRPRPATGAEFKRDWLQFYGNRPDHRRMGVVMLVDPSSGEKKTSGDYTSIWVIGLGEDENYYVLDMLRDRLSLTERAEAVFSLHRKWRPGEVRYERYGMMGDIQYLRSEMDRKNYRFRVVEVGGSIAKEDRIRRLVPLFQRGFIWMPQTHMVVLRSGETVDLVEQFVSQEYLSFPVGKHDDMLDALARVAEPNLDLAWPMKKKNTVRIAPMPIMDAAVGY